MNTSVLEYFSEISLVDLEVIDGGAFLDGLALIGTSITVGAAAIAAVVAAPAVGTAAGVAVGIAIISSQFGGAVGLAMMFGAKL